MSNSNRLFTGVKYKVDQQDWTTDMNVPENVSTVEQFIQYLNTVDTGAYSSIGRDSTINVNVQQGNRATELSAIRPDAPSSDVDGHLCFVTFNRNSKRGG